MLTNCTGLAALLYLAAGLSIVRAIRSGADRAPGWLRALVVCGVLLHAYAIQGEMFQSEAVHFGFGYAVSIAVFFAVIMLLIESWIHRLHGQFGIVLIVSAAGALMPVFFPGEPSASAQWSTFLRCHLLFALAAYSFMGIALVHAVLMSLQNRYLKAPAEESRFLASMPGLVVMERIFFRIVIFGFVCLTVVVLTGAVATGEVYGTFFHLDHKTILTWVSWVLFGILLLGRFCAGWRARRALVWFWAGFVVQVVAYLCYSFVQEVF